MLTIRIAPIMRATKVDPSRFPMLPEADWHVVRSTPVLDLLVANVDHGALAAAITKHYGIPYSLPTTGCHPTWVTVYK